MMEVILDTSHWINFEKQPSKHHSFLEAKQTHGFEVTFTRANAEDLAETDNQDFLSKIIAETADVYLAIDDI